MDTNNQITKPKEAGRLSCAARKRLAYYRAKGVPLERARVLAKQPMPKVERGRKAGSSLKWEGSANTTPEMSLPKRGSAKPGAGATPARVLEIEAGSLNRKAAQPPIPRPTETTRTREHRSYSEVASSDRFAVISKGYPTALLSTKELVMVREAILGVVKPNFTGCSLRPDSELVAEADMPRPRIYVGYFPKTEKCSNEDILQLLEGQNRALRIGDWRTLNRAERGKHVELTLSVDPVSDDLLKSQGYTLCYGFGLVNVRPKNRHSVGVKDTAAEPEPGTASTTQVQEVSQELPCCSNSIAPSSNTQEEEKEKTVGSTLEGPSTSAKAAKMERPATNAPQFITEDLVAMWAKVPTAGGEQEAVLASAYFPGDSSDAPPREVSALVEYCQDKRIRWIIGCDANAHHTVWGSTDVNKREKEACIGALRLQGVANPKSGDLTGHLKILEIIFSSPIVHLSDVQLPRMVFKRNFTVAIIDRNSWRNPNLCTPSGAQVWYTDGSKL
ncbi:hypothetical protein ACLKA6_008527 [Drosophila palustris]